MSLPGISSPPITVSGDAGGGTDISLVSFTTTNNTEMTIPGGAVAGDFAIVGTHAYYRDGSENGCNWNAGDTSGWSTSGGVQIGGDVWIGMAWKTLVSGDVTGGQSVAPEPDWDDEDYGCGFLAVFTGGGVAGTLSVQHNEGATNSNLAAKTITNVDADPRILFAIAAAAGGQTLGAAEMNPDPDTTLSGARSYSEAAYKILVSGDTDDFVVDIDDAGSNNALIMTEFEFAP